MIRLITVVGARPQFIKASAISRCIKNNYQDQVSEQILHTGQHYDESMSDVFFQQMQIPNPSFHLNIGSASHAKQTGSMMDGIEKVLKENQPDAVLVYGDTNSTLAASLAASKIHIPVIHVEAGLRSFNKKMPEEINRIVTDHVSTFLFTPTHQGYQNLLSEGLKHLQSKPVSADNPLLLNTGDVMYDNVLYFQQLANTHSTIISNYRLENDPLILCTIHRDFNTDHPERLKKIIEGLIEITKKYPHKIVIPLHPRTDQMLQKAELSNLFKAMKINKQIVLTAPLGYFDMLQLLSACEMVITDSGGLQKEAYFLKKPVAILRNETEWTEIIESGNGWLTDDDTMLLLNACKQGIEFDHGDFPMYYGDGKASDKIIQALVENLK